MPAAKPEHVRRRAVELARTLGSRGAAAALAREGIKVSKTVIDDWSRGDLAARAGAAPAAAQISEPASSMEELPTELRDVDPATLDFQKLEALERDVMRFREHAKRGGAARTYAALARLHIEILGWKAKLRPPAIVAPDEDPSNLKAKAELRARLERLRADTEASAAGRAQIRAHLDALERPATGEAA